MKKIFGIVLLGFVAVSIFRLARKKENRGVANVNPGLTVPDDKPSSKTIPEEDELKEEDEETDKRFKKLKLGQEMISKEFSCGLTHERITVFSWIGVREGDPVVKCTICGREISFPLFAISKFNRSFSDYFEESQNQEEDQREEKQKKFRFKIKKRKSQRVDEKELKLLTKEKGL